jgi:hypothetical protein
LRQLCWIITYDARYVWVTTIEMWVDRRDAPRETDLCSYLMQDIFTEVKLPEEFLNELAKRFHDDGLIDVIGSTIMGIAEEIAAIKFNESYRSVAIRVHHCMTKSLF